MGVGLRGPELHPLDPAAAADFVLPTITVTLLSTSADFRLGEGTGKASGQRFPVMGVLFPVGRAGRVFASFSTAFDLRWGTTVTRTVELGEVVGLARVTDQFASDGGVSTLRLGWSKRVNPTISVGLSGGPYLGDVVRSFFRSIDSAAVRGFPEPTVEQGAWDFSGFTGTAGLGVTLGETFHFSGSVTTSSALEATPKGATEGEALDFDLPVEWRGGATVNLTPDLIGVASVEWADYDEVIGEESQIATRGSTMDWGLGAEWAQPTFRGSPMPVRLGYGSRQLPFLFDQGTADETYFTAGLGIQFVPIANNPLGLFDISLEKGSRDAPGLSEDFWRFSMSLRISGL